MTEIFFFFILEMYGNVQNPLTDQILWHKWDYKGKLIKVVVCLQFVHENFIVKIFSNMHQKYVVF